MATAAKAGASKSLQLLFILSGSGMLIFILFVLVAAQASGMDINQGKQGLKKLLFMYISKANKATKIFYKQNLSREEQREAVSWQAD